VLARPAVVGRGGYRVLGTIGEKVSNRFA
jgi:hypothetical protein